MKNRKQDVKIVLDKRKANFAWKKLPMPKDLNDFVYGNDQWIGFAIYEDDKLNESILIPELENGYYCFIDRRNPEKANQNNFQELLNSSS